MHLPFSQPWADAFCAAIESDADYREAGKGWSAPMALVLEPAPALGFTEELAVELALDRGRCTGARAIPARDVAAPYVLRGSYDAWKRVVRGELDPVLAVTTGQLRLAKGALMTLMLHTRFARALVACARDVPTRFPDEERSAGA